MRRRIFSRIEEQDQRDVHRQRHKQGNKKRNDALALHGEIMGQGFAFGRDNVVICQPAVGLYDPFVVFASNGCIRGLESSV